MLSLEWNALRRFFPWHVESIHRSSHCQAAHIWQEEGIKLQLQYVIGFCYVWTIKLAESSYCYMQLQHKQQDKVLAFCYWATRVVKWRVWNIIYKNRLFQISILITACAKFLPTFNQFCKVFHFNFFRI